MNTRSKPREARPTVGRGFRLGPLQDHVLRRMMTKSGLTLTELVHRGLGTVANEMGEHWPEDDYSPVSKAG